MLYFLTFVVSVTGIILFLHSLSYKWLKSAIVSRQSWDLNVCCGTTDGGGVNVDIVQHADVPNFLKVDSIYNLPFEDQRFDTVLCSHTIEHVEYPRRLDRELRRVAKEVVYVLPPVWDVAAALNIFEHRWLFLTLRKEHRSLPRCTPLPFARKLQARIGQRVAA